MATIREMIVRFVVDAGGIRRGVEESVGQMNRLSVTLEQQKAAWERSGGSIAQYNRELAKLARGQLTAAQSVATTEVAITKATTMTEQQLAKQALATERATARIEKAQTQMMNRMQRIGVGVVFAFDAMTRSAQAGEGAWRRVLRQMSMLAILAFEPPAGLIVAAIAAGTDAMIDAFTKQARASDKAKRQFISDMIEIERAHDTMRAAMAKQFAFSGDPFARQGQGKNVLTGEDVDAKETQAQFAARSQGLIGLVNLQRSLNQRVAEQGKLLNQAAREQAFFAAQAHLTGLLTDPIVKKYALLLQELKQTNQLAEQYANHNSESEAVLSRVLAFNKELTRNAFNLAQDTKVPKEFASEVERLVGIFEHLNREQQSAAIVGDAMLGAFDHIARQLTRLRNEGKTVFDPLVESLLKAQEALQRTDLIKALRLGQLPALAVPSRTRSGTGGSETNPTPAFQFTAMPDIIGALLRAIERSGGVRAAAAPKVDAGVLTKLVGPSMAAMLRDIGSQMKASLGATMIAAFGPVAVLMRALEPAITALTPLFDRLAVPVAMIARIIVALVEPALRALWPVIRLVGIGLTFLGEVISRITAALAQAIGGLVKAIGNLIAKVPGLGGVGRAIANFGQSMLTFADGQKKAADEFARARKELQGMTWDQTADALARLQGAASSAAEQLTNIPSSYRIARAVFLATRPINESTLGTPNMNMLGAGGGASMYFAPGSIVIEGSEKSASQLFDDVANEARRKSMARVGTTAQAARTFG